MNASDKKRWNTLSSKVRDLIGTIQEMEGMQIEALDSYDELSEKVQEKLDEDDFSVAIREYDFQSLIDAIETLPDEG